MAYNMQSMQSIQVKTFSFGRECYQVPKINKKRAMIADILDARIFSTAVGEKFCHPKTPILGQKRPEIHFFLKKG